MFSFYAEILPESQLRGIKSFNISALFLELFLEFSCFFVICGNKLIFITDLANLLIEPKIRDRTRGWQIFEHFRDVTLIRTFQEPWRSYPLCGKIIMKYNLLIYSILVFFRDKDIFVRIKTKTRTDFKLAALQTCLTSSFCPSTAEAVWISPTN